MLFPYLVSAATSVAPCNLGDITGSVTLDGRVCGASAGSFQNFFATLTGNVTLDIANFTAGVYSIELTQDGTGGRTTTFSANFTDGPTSFVTTAGMKNRLLGVYDGSKLIIVTASRSTGALNCTQLPPLVGDVTSSGGTCSTTFSGTISQLAANGANCSAGSFPLGVDTFAAVESCTALPTSIVGTSGNLTASAPTGTVTLDLGATATQTDQANTYTTGAQDFGAATSLKVPVAAGATTATNGFVAYDSTNNMLHAAQTGADAKVPQFTIAPANDECVKWVVSGANYKLGSAGAACGSGGGGGLADPGSNGMLARTALNVTAARTIAGTAPVGVTNGDGVGGAPTVTCTTCTTDTNTQTLTNKRVSPRVVALTDAATVTVNLDTTDVGTLATLSQTTDFPNPTGTPTDGQSLVLRIASSTARVLTWGSVYSEGTGLPLPTSTTGAGIIDYFGFKYNSTSTKLEIVASTGASGSQRTEYMWFPGAKCSGTNATTIWDTVAVASNPGLAACVAGTNIHKGVMDFANDVSRSIQTGFRLPDDWVSTVDAKFKWSSSVTTGDVVWQLATVCVADSETDDPAFNTASVVTDTAKGTANQLNDASITGVDVTGCAAGEFLHLKLFRDPAHASDTHTGTARLQGLELTIRRSGGI